MLLSVATEHGKRCGQTPPFSRREQDDKAAGGPGGHMVGQEDPRQGLWDPVCCSRVVLGQPISPSFLTVSPTDGVLQGTIVKVLRPPRPH